MAHSSKSLLRAIFLFVALCYFVEMQQQNKTGELNISLRLPELNPITIKQNEARTYTDHGWILIKNGQEIPDPTKTPVQVTVEFPDELRAGKVGSWEVRYKAYDPVDRIESPIRTRTVIVIDIDECTLPEGDPDRHKCSPNAVCLNTAGSYKCKCNEGFEDKSPVGFEGTKCVDIDECQRGLHDCDPNAECVNLSPGYACACRTGFEGDGKRSGSGCTNINECVRAPPFCHNCHSDAMCIDTSPGFYCVCKEGFRGDGVIRCHPINPCDDGRHNCPKDAVCQPLPVPPYYKCDCGPGREFNAKTGTCNDINECADATLNKCDPLTSRCVNLDPPEFYRCDCIDGYEHPPRDKIRCVDIDECLKETHNCDINAKCINLDPLRPPYKKYECRCNAPAWIGDGYTCKKNVTGRVFDLNRGNLTIPLCSNYIEYGYILDEDKGKGVFVRSKIPRELEQQYVTKRGVYLINYTAEDISGQVKEHAVREVTVTGNVDHCSYPPGHPCRHKCMSPSDCVYDDTVDDGYRCKCPLGTIVPPGTACPDDSPPRIVLQPSGSDYIVFPECRVCNHTFRESRRYRMAEHGHWVEAYDIDATGTEKNITHKITSREVPANDPKNPQDYYVKYDVIDDAGNPAPTATRHIHYDIQDVQAAINQIQEDMKKRELANQRSQEFPYRIAGVLGKILLFLPYLIGLVIAMYVSSSFEHVERVVFIIDWTESQV